MATIKDVAKRANVSISTVSLAIKLYICKPGSEKRICGQKRKNSSCSYGKYNRSILV